MCIWYRMHLGIGVTLATDDVSRSTSFRNRQVLAVRPVSPCRQVPMVQSKPGAHCKMTCIK